jgi:hypothetical protein
MCDKITKSFVDYCIDAYLMHICAHSAININNIKSRMHVDRLYDTLCNSLCESVGQTCMRRFIIGGNFNEREVVSSLNHQVA